MLYRIQGYLNDLFVLILLIVENFHSGPMCDSIHQNPLSSMYQYYQPDGMYYYAAAHGDWSTRILMAYTHRSAHEDWATRSDNAHRHEYLANVLACGGNFIIGTGWMPQKHWLLCVLVFCVGSVKFL